MSAHCIDVPTSDTKCAACKNCTINRILQVLTLTLCLVTIVSCYILLRYITESNANLQVKVTALQRKLSALDQQLQNQNKVFGALSNEDFQLIKQQKVLTDFETKSRQKRENTQKTKKNDPKKATDKQKTKRRKKLNVVQIVGEGGEHYPYERFTGIFTKWKYADFITDEKTMKYVKQKFTLNPKNGKVTVQKKGLYLIYAQITLMGNGSLGYMVKVKDKVLLSCFANTEINNSSNKSTCTTMGLVSLDRKAKIYIEHANSENGKALFHSNASFFGLLQIPYRL